MSKPLVIVGDSAFAEVAREYFDHDSDYRVAAFAVERAYLKREELQGLPVVALEDLSTRFAPGDHHVHVAVTYVQLNRLRRRLCDEARRQGFSLASYVSSKAFVWRNVVLGEHCFVFEDNTVQPHVRIGDNVVLWSGNHIGHHSVVRDHCFLSSHVVVSGFCDIGESSFLGVNATVANNVTIGRDNWVGPGVVILKDTEPNSLFGATQPDASRVSATRFFRVPA